MLTGQWWCQHLILTGQWWYQNLMLLVRTRHVRTACLLVGSDVRISRWLVPDNDVIVQLILHAGLFLIISSSSFLLRLPPTTCPLYFFLQLIVHHSFSSPLVILLSFETYNYVFHLIHPVFPPRVFLPLSLLFILLPTFLFLFPSPCSSSLFLSFFHTPAPLFFLLFVLPFCDQFALSSTVFPSIFCFLFIFLYLSLSSFPLLSVLSLLLSAKNCLKFNSHPFLHTTLSSAYFMWTYCDI